MVIRVASLTAIVIGVWGLTGARAGEPVRKKVTLGSPITHSDWMVRNPSPAWGPEGVRQILDRCKQCGWKRVYWRCFDGGRALYRSRLLEPLHGFDEDNYHRGRDSAWVLDKLKPLDWGSFDAFGEAIAYGRRIGLEVHAWLTINEDDHGWGLISRFSREHPDMRWVRRDGNPFRSQVSFAFPKAREYKLGLVKEILAYEPDGLFFDWIRTGDVRDNPHTDKDGVALYGYETPNLEQFRAKYGADARTVPNGDERWVRVRAEPQTVFVREAHRLIKAKSKRIVISAMVQNPWGYRGGPNDTIYKDNLRGLLLDVPTWASEGLIDEVVAAGYYRPGGSPEAAYKAIREETGNKVPAWLYGWLGSKDQFLNDVQLAERLGAPHLLLWESDSIGLPPANEPTVKAMADYAGK